MNFKQLETFFWAGRLGSFQAAADRLSTTQPGVSTRIKELEYDLGTPLFDRTGRSAQLTPQGRELMAFAERMIDMTEEIRQRLGSPSTMSGLIRLGVADTIALTWLPELVARIGRQFPLFSVELEVDLTVHLLRKLQEHTIDVGFLVGPVPGPELAVEPLWSTPVAWIASSLLVEGDGPFTAAMLAEVPIISHTRGTHQHLAIDQWFRSAGVIPKREISCSSLASIIRLVESGLGISVLSPIVVEAGLRERRLRVLQAERPFRPNDFVVAYALRSLQPAAAAFADAARNTVAALPMPSFS